jgi:hypothetical protein
MGAHEWELANELAGDLDLRRERGLGEEAVAGGAPGDRSMIWKSPGRDHGQIQCRADALHQIKINDGHDGPRNSIGC